MYCAATVYIYVAKTDPSNDISPRDASNLEILVHAMEAISRNNLITRSLLRQTCHDIDANGLASKMRFPALAKYRQSETRGLASIPLFARSSVSRDSEIMPVLPGRLPLENPKGQRLDLDVVPSGHATAKRLTGADCYQCMIGAVCRNVSVDTNQPAVVDVSDNCTNKRKRTMDSPVSQDRDGNIASTQNAAPPGNPLESNRWRRGPNSLGSVFSLPDRSSPSNTASPVLQNPNGGGSAGSSNESPAAVSGLGTSAVFGLGNTPAENRIDLRAFQDRMINAPWPSQDDMFAAQITTSLMDTGELPGGISMPWNFSSDDLPPWNGP
ncbi:binuclear zinc transcription factor [Cordyceps fumosorosea ARSEF 2679]|uniref:Binuclear zinc transcription factor n=1 Tax=Cordyceps fumosorosea (strain ARSEF 2679) TaxID=1081104 RepID=A0A167RS86_CORFA|nr:binuclear zinc transcription factor [Cordyceps fumosorosea ARSEF 2679]OAA58887.1 binuclear zinc transcription factor [Cordyceps fumosorosea ARSEF 2679]